MWIATIENDEEFITNLKRIDWFSLRHSEYDYDYIDFCGSPSFRIGFFSDEDANKAYLKILNTLQHPDGTKLIDLRGFKTDSDYYE